MGKGVLRQKVGHRIVIGPDGTDPYGTKFKEAALHHGGVQHAAQRAEIGRLVEIGGMFNGQMGVVA